MKRFTLFCCLLLSLQAFSQDTKLLFKISPFAALDDISFPTLQGGLELALTKKISWYSELGVQYRKSSFEEADTSFLQSNGYKIKTELRYYWKPDPMYGPGRLTGLYTALNFSYSRNTYNTSLMYAYRDDPSKDLTDDCGVKRTIWGINAIAGLQAFPVNWLVLDIYAGLGARGRKFSTVNMEYDPLLHELNKPNDFTIAGNRQAKEAKEENSVIVGLSCGIRVGVRIF